MADEIRVTNVGGTEVHTIAGQPAGPEGPVVIDAKEEIQATRARISGTLDEIEGKILQKKEQIEQRLDFLAPVRERPLRILGAVFGAGLALGLLTGGGEEGEDEEDEAEEKETGTDDLAEIWEGRARRLLRIAREQEEEIEALRQRLARRGARAARMEDEVEEEEGESDSTVDRLRGYLSEHLSGLATEAVQQLLRRVVRG